MLPRSIEPHAQVTTEVVDRLAALRDDPSIRVADRARSATASAISRVTSPPRAPTSPPQHWARCLPNRSAGARPARSIANGSSGPRRSRPTTRSQAGRLRCHPRPRDSLADGHHAARWLSSPLPHAARPLRRPECLSPKSPQSSRQPQSLLPPSERLHASRPTTAARQPTSRTAQQPKLPRASPQPVLAADIHRWPGALPTGSARMEHPRMAARPPRRRVSPPLRGEDMTSRLNARAGLLGDRHRGFHRP